MQKKGDWKVPVIAVYEDLGADGKVVRREERGEYCTSPFDPGGMLTAAVVTGDTSKWPDLGGRFDVMTEAFPRLTGCPVQPARLETAPLFGGNFKYVFSNRRGEAEKWQAV